MSADATVAHALGDTTEPGHPVQTAMAAGRPKYEPEPRSCPDCEQGKHANCTGEAWDNDADAPTVCPCSLNRAGPHHLGATP